MKDKDREHAQEPAPHMRNVLSDAFCSFTQTPLTKNWVSYLSALVKLAEDLRVVIQTVS